MILRAAALALATSVLAAPAAQAGPALVDQTDPVGDVHIYDGGGTRPSTGQRRSIDLTRFTVTRHGDDVRFTFRIARIVAGRSFDQLVEAQFVKTDRHEFELDVLADPQHKTGTAYFGSSTACHVDVGTSRRTGTVRVDVPGSCIPEGAGVLVASTYTVEKNFSGPGFSEDTLRVQGKVTL